MAIALFHDELYYGQTMKRRKWPDFLFTIALRFTSGLVLGCLVCLFFFWKGILRSFSHDDARGPLILTIICGLVGGIIGVLTVPHWQTPWYKGVTSRDDGSR